MSFPTRFTEDRQNRIIEALRQGAMLSGAARSAGVSRQALHTWLSATDDKFQAFQELVEEAQGAAQVQAEQAVYAADPKFWLLHGPARERYDRDGNLIEGWGRGPGRPSLRDDGLGGAKAALESRPTLAKAALESHPTLDESLVARERDDWVLAICLATEDCPAIRSRIRAALDSVREARLAREPDVASPVAAEPAKDVNVAVANGTGVKDVSTVGLTARPTPHPGPLPRGERERIEDSPLPRGERERIEDGPLLRGERETDKEREKVKEAAAVKLVNLDQTHGEPEGEEKASSAKDVNVGSRNESATPVKDVKLGEVQSPTTSSGDQNPALVLAAVYRKMEENLRLLRGF